MGQSTGLPLISCHTGLHAARVSYGQDLCDQEISGLSQRQLVLSLYKDKEIMAEHLSADARKVLHWSLNKDYVMALHE